MLWVLNVMWKYLIIFLQGNDTFRKEEIFDHLLGQTIYNIEH